MPSLRSGLVSTFRGIMRLYFRRVERLGLAPDANTRGRVFVANHTNALIDPILVITDAACEISPIAKSTLWSVPGLRWLLDHAGAVPIIRRKDSPDKDAAANDATFEKIASHLAGGGNILIFPEGTSHSEPQLAPLRTGAARMLAASHDLGGVATYQAVGLEFDAPSDFRSRCLVLWGPVRRFADLAGDREARVRAATAQMAADLRELLVEGGSHDERELVAHVAELLANDAGDGSLGGWNTIGRQVELASKALHGEVRAVVARAVEGYYARLASHRLRDAQVCGRSDSHEPPASPRWAARILLAPLAATGFALYAIPYFVPRLVANRMDADAVSTVKLGVALVVYPLWAAALVGASLTLLPPPLSVVGAAVAIASPFAALHWLDAWYQRDAAPTTNEQLAELVRLRAAATAAIAEARARFEQLS